MIFSVETPPSWIPVWKQMPAASYVVSIIGEGLGGNLADLAEAHR